MRVFVIAILASMAAASAPLGPWVPDRGDGTYRNPVIFADYSDPDAVRVGDDFYLVSSSFASVPGLPILHSKDLVNWTIVGHAAPRLISPDFDVPQHGKGIWAPSLRHHGGRFWIYVGDPDRGIYAASARDPRGPWSPLTLVKPTVGAIDPCPLWDDDGKIYLVHAWAKSRAGFNSVLTVTPLTPDGLHVDGKDVQVFDGHAHHPTIEGPKFYKRNGYYYIFAPAGGVATGWQTVLRSKSVLGPYEDRIVMNQGKSEVNGPHQGAWVETAVGESWFLHFQDRGAYGRVVHLQPMTWKDDWPMIGVDTDGDGIGEPVATFRKPVTSSAAPITTPQTSDEFDGSTLGLQWQWNANPSPDWASLTTRRGWLRLRSVAGTPSTKSIFSQGAVLLQKTPAEEFVVSARIDASALALGERAGLAVLGRDTASLSVVRRPDGGLAIVRSIGAGVDASGGDADGPLERLPNGVVTLRATFSKDGMVRFDVDGDAVKFVDPGEGFIARPGVWVGARVGLFAYRSVPEAKSSRPGQADVDWFRIESVH